MDICALNVRSTHTKPIRIVVHSSVNSTKSQRQSISLFKIDGRGSVTNDLPRNKQMSDTTANNKRIAKNTMLLYFRMFLMMAISLYTSRVVLKVLGVEDFGIYNVVGGIVSMMGVINGAM